MRRRLSRVGRAPTSSSAAGPITLSLALLAFSAVMLLGCGGGASSSASSDEAGRFDADRAWGLIEQQLAAGQRPAGSPQLRKLAEQLRPLLPSGRFEAIPKETGLRNIVGVLPGRKPAVLLGAHYDTLAKPPGFVGANNGAAGTAVVVEAARALQEMAAGREPREVRFVLFDGEEPPGVKAEGAANFYKEGLRGSRAYVAANPGETNAAVVVDYVANRDLRLPREANSTKALWSQVLKAAKAANAERFFSAKTGPPIADDHAPFLLEGVPAVDLIDWSYPGHSLSDGLDKLSKQSLDAVGETVVQLVYELRR